MSSMHGQIIVGIDLEDSSDIGRSRAVALSNFAHALEKRLKSSVHLIYVSSSKGDIEDHSKVHPQELERLRELAKNRSWIFSLKSGAPVSELLKLGSDTDSPVEIYVLGVRGIGIIKRLYLGSVTEELAKNSERPLALLSSQAIASWEKKSELSIDGRILVATDLSDRSQSVETYAMSFAKRIGSSVTLIHNTWRTYKSMEDAAIQAGAVPLIFEETIQTIERQSREALLAKQKFFEEHGVECEFILDTEARSVAESVIAVQEGNYSLLFMGSRTKNRFVTAVWGSTLRDTLSLTRLPVIGVKC